MANIIQEYDEYTITNGTVQWLEDEKHIAATKLGCTGTLSVETEIKVVSKKCEGTEVKNIPIPQKMTGTFSGHMPVQVLRKAFGLTNKDLKKGVYSYGVGSRSGRGIFTWETLNLEETIKKLMAFPNANMTGGFKFNLENGGDEIAEVEMTIDFLKDSNRQFYYEAFEDELEDETVKKDWMEKFSLELVSGETLGEE